MAKTPSYSTLFSCIYDEPEPYGSLGRGTHYSVMRSVERVDLAGKPLDAAQIHDFAVIWDEDHDTRIIEVIERMYMAGRLAPVHFIGERKGCLTIIHDSGYAFSEGYERDVIDIAQSFPDPWILDIGKFDKARARTGDWRMTQTHGLISDDPHRVNLYLSNIDSLWNLGTKDHGY